jgi:hypothetical protein
MRIWTAFVELNSVRYEHSNETLGFVEDRAYAEQISVY